VASDFFLLSQAVMRCASPGAEMGIRPLLMEVAACHRAVSCCAGAEVVALLRQASLQAHAAMPQEARPRAVSCYEAVDSVGIPLLGREVSLRTCFEVQALAELHFAQGSPSEEQLGLRIATVPLQVEALYSAPAAVPQKALPL